MWLVARQLSNKSVHRIEGRSLCFVLKFLRPVSCVVSWLRIETLHLFFEIVCKSENTQRAIGEGSGSRLSGDRYLSYLPQIIFNQVDIERFYRKEIQIAKSIPDLHLDISFLKQTVSKLNHILFVNLVDAAVLHPANALLIPQQYLSVTSSLDFPSLFHRRR